MRMILCVAASAGGAGINRWPSLRARGSLTQKDSQRELLSTLCIIHDNNCYTQMNNHYHFCA